MVLAFWVRMIVCVTGWAWTVCFVTFMWDVCRHIFGYRLFAGVGVSAAMLRHWCFAGGVTDILDDLRGSSCGGSRVMEQALFI